jgi:hypothetical protein
VRESVANPTRSTDDRRTILSSVFASPRTVSIIFRPACTNNFD